jgi:hypothetical protein
MGSDYDRVKKWRIENPKKYKEQKRRERESKNINKTQVELRVIKLVEGARTRSRKKEIPFNVKYKDIPTPTHCPYLGIELSYDGVKSDGMASLDRIIPELGYVLGNIQIISLLANQMKSSATLEQLLRFSESVIRIHTEPQS